MMTFELARELGVDVSTCIALCNAAGVGVRSGLDHVSAAQVAEVQAFRRTQPTVRTVTPSASSIHEQDKWIASGAGLWEAAGWRRGFSRHRFNHLMSVGKFWATNEPIDLGRPIDGVSNWLDEVRARAKLLGPLVRIANEWPVCFSTDRFDVIVWVDHTELFGWVGQREGVPARIDLRTWEVSRVNNRPDVDIAIGLSICWYLDLGLRRTDHPHFTDSVDDSDRRWTEPSPAFAADVHRQRTTSWRPPVAHRVRGHIRTLTDKQPREESRANAPADIRRNMGPDDTFVRLHERGDGASSGELLTHLRSASNLSDFVGALRLARR
jgi:hypothetical protein